MPFSPPDHCLHMGGPLITGREGRGQVDMGPTWRKKDPAGFCVGRRGDGRGMTARPGLAQPLTACAPWGDTLGFGAAALDAPQALAAPRWPWSLPDRLLQLGGGGPACEPCDVRGARAGRPLSGTCPAPRPAPRAAVCQAALPRANRWAHSCSRVNMCSVPTPGTSFGQKGPRSEGVVCHPEGPGGWVSDLLWG